MRRVLRDEVEQVEHRLSVLARAEECQRGVVCLLGLIGAPRVGPRRRRRRRGGRGGRNRRRDQRPRCARCLGLAQVLLGRVQPRAEPRRLGAVLAERRLQFGVPGLQGAQLPDQARQLA